MSDKWCRHFNGIQYGECKAGVAYETVTDRSVRPSRWPCHGELCDTICAQYEPHTPEELAEMERKMQEKIKHLFAFESRESDICPHCGKQVTALKQVGRCVYTSCGCRLWQGKVPKAWA